MDGSQPGRSKPRPPIHHISYAYLLVVPVLLAISTAALLFLHSDVNVGMLYSQCHSRARVPWLSHVPVLGAPACFLVSFFQEALAAARSVAIMAVILSFVGGLLTVSTVEAARLCNAPNVLIAYPTGPWLVFNLLGGAIVWELVIIPAFFHRSRQILTARRAAAGRGGATVADPHLGEAMRHLAVDAEVVAIPVAVALGYVVPSVLMVVLDTPPAIVVWLFFPLLVSLVRQAVRFGVTLVRAHGRHGSVHLESHRAALALVYAVPIACSALSHGLFIWNFVTQKDDRREMTRSTLKFVEIDVAFIALTVLYWLFVEAGWRVTLVVLGTSILLGPGAGLCIGWIYRESSVALDPHVTVVAVGSRGGEGEADEDTPLLR